MHSHALCAKARRKLADIISVRRFRFSGLGFKGYRLLGLGLFSYRVILFTCATDTAAFTSRHASARQPNLHSSPPPTPWPRLSRPAGLGSVRSAAAALHLAAAHPASKRREALAPARVASQYAQWSPPPPPRARARARAPWEEAPPPHTTPTSPAALFSPAPRRSLRRSSPPRQRSPKKSIPRARAHPGASAGAYTRPLFSSTEALCMGKGVRVGAV